MKQKQKMIIGTALVTILFCFLISNTSQAIPIEDYELIGPGGTSPIGIISAMGDLKTISGNYQANGSIDFFITDDSMDLNSYAMTGIIPPDVLYQTSGPSANFDVEVENGSAMHHMMFGNINDETYWKNVTYSLDVTVEMGIPGFEFIYVLFTLLGILAILHHKKKLNF